MRPKQALLAALLVLAGCGGSGETAAMPAPQTVRGTGFAFTAPAGWKVETSGRQVSAKRGSGLVQVTAFALVKAYRPELFDAVARELAARMGQVARQSGGKIVRTSTAEPAGIRSHVFDVETGGGVDRYTFVLRGRREYLLLCRRDRSADDAPCAQLVETFRLS